MNVLRTAVATVLIAIPVGILLQVSFDFTSLLPRRT